MKPRSIRQELFPCSTVAGVIFNCIVVLVVIFSTRVVRRVALEPYLQLSCLPDSQGEGHVGDGGLLGMIVPNTTAPQRPGLTGSWPPSDRPPIVLYRLIGNNMIPLQCYGQLYKNTRFTLEHEPELPGCKKMWMLNNIVNRTERGMILDLLLSHNYTTEDVIVKRINYTWLAQFPKEEWTPLVTALNEARNAILQRGIQAGARWVLPFDGNQFFTLQAWESIRAALADWEQEGFPYFKVPMFRIYSEQDASWLNQTTNFTMVTKYAPIMWESQFGFRNDSTSRYAEGANHTYGKDTKLELLDRVCGTGDAPRSGHVANTGSCGCHKEVGNDRQKRPVKEEVALRCGYSVRLWYYPCEGIDKTNMFTKREYRAALRVEAKERLGRYIEREMQLAGLLTSNTSL